MKCRLLQMCNEIVENQDLYRNKDDFGQNFERILYLMSISVK